MRSPLDVRPFCEQPAAAELVGNHLCLAGCPLAAPERLAFWELARQFDAELADGRDADRVRSLRRLAADPSAPPRHRGRRGASNRPRRAWRAR